MGTVAVEVPIETLNVSAYRIPTDSPEADGTLAWDATVLVLVEITAGGNKGIGYTYAAGATAHFIHEVLRPFVLGREALAVQGSWDAMVRLVRNQGVTGVSAMAISAVDIALW